MDTIYDQLRDKCADAKTNMGDWSKEQLEVWIIKAIGQFATIADRMEAEDHQMDTVSHTLKELSAMVDPIKAEAAASHKRAHACKYLQKTVNLLSNLCLDTLPKNNVWVDRVKELRQRSHILLSDLGID